MSYKVGDRVTAVMAANKDTKTMRVFGSGVYDGDFLHNVWGAEVLNPRITLDNGKTVWGCECWWGAEDKLIPPSDWTVIQVDIDEDRAKALEATEVGEETDDEDTD